MYLDARSKQFANAAILAELRPWGYLKSCRNANGCISLLATKGLCRYAVMHEGPLFPELFLVFRHDYYALRRVLSTSVHSSCPCYLYGFFSC